MTRVRHIRGHAHALERTLESERECAGVLQLMAACRGALNGVMTLWKGTFGFTSFLSNNSETSLRARAAEELIDVVRAYLQ
ncbi:MAG TPA: metal-sensing transcriptional repressor [Candidatus Sulfotelmatobacter sp.]|nr:metal-sensing transcriptional repressor [Candidatus Sulfotelmatobacter sp.]